MHDALSIIDLEVWTHIGVPAEERESEQRLLVSVEMSLDIHAAAKADDVKKSINYADVAADIKTLAQKERKTIETLAEDIAQMILKNHKAPAVTVTVKKFALPNAREVQITITRPTI